MESLVLGGGLDCFENLERSQYFAPSEKYDTLIEHALRYGNAHQAQRAQAVNSLFGDSEDAMIPEPKIPEGVSWPLIEKLNREKEVTGIYVSGHPLDDYRIEIENFTTSSLENLNQHQHRASVTVGCMVANARHMISKNGNGWGIFEISDFNGQMEFRLFGEDYQKFKHLLEPGMALYIKGKFQKRWNSEELEFKPVEIKLLEGIAENMTESITLKFPIERINDAMINQIDQLCQTHKGRHRLKMVLLDQTHRVKLSLIAKERKVNAGNELIAELDKLGLDYKVN